MVTEEYDDIVRALVIAIKFLESNAQTDSTKVRFLSTINCIPRTFEIVNELDVWTLHTPDDLQIKLGEYKNKIKNGNTGGNISKEA